MSRKKKLGSAARFGARYGIKIKQRVAKIERERNHECPNCLKPGIKRQVAGIWTCSKCGLKMAGKAYRP